MQVDRRRKGILDLLLVNREFIAAGFRCPELVARLVARLPREHREVLTTFMAEFERLLLSADQLQAGPSAGDARLPPTGPTKMAARPSAGIRPLKANPLAAWKTAVIGSHPSPPDPSAIETYITSASTTLGLVHGDVLAMNTFLETYPAVERYLARQLVGVDDLFSFGEDKDDISDANKTPKRSDAAADCDVSAFEPVRLIDAFAQASMLWTQSHPVDLAAIARDRAAMLASPSTRKPPKFEDTQKMLLRCNIALRFPQKDWEMLLLQCDAAKTELGAISDELLSCGADVTHESKAVSARGRLIIAISNCCDGLTNIGPSATPTTIKETLTLRLTHLLADVTSIVHDAGVVLTASGATATPVAPAKQTLLQRLSSKGKPDASADSGLDELGRQAFSLAQATKRHIRTAMQPMLPDSGGDAQSTNAEPA
jgi:hypothetical protein